MPRAVRRAGSREPALHAKPGGSGSDSQSHGLSCARRKQQQQQPRTRRACTLPPNGQEGSSKASSAR
eukprot:216401-Alexandrium_andersonii.AAC.1